jgi:calcium-dependent protein kinase
MYIVTNFLGKNERDELQQTFMALDKNADGKLSREELIDGYTEIYGNAEEAEKEVKCIMRNVDVDHNGYINYSGSISLTVNRVLASFNKQEEDFVGREFEESISVV